MLWTVPQLLLAALGEKPDRGDQLCFFCGAACPARNPASERVLESFTGRSDVAAPGSEWVCGGCVLCLRESCRVDMVDGTRGRLVGKAAMRAFSWVIARASALAASKAHLDYLRILCLRPPRPPFAIVLSDSGKKHLLYRGIVCRERAPVSLTLEAERITYQPADLAERLDLCGRIIAATGKPALAEPPGVRLAMGVCDHYPDIGADLIARWEKCHGEPLSRLAAWLSAGKEEQRLLHPAEAASSRRGGVPAEAGRPHRSRSPARKRR